MKLELNEPHIQHIYLNLSTERENICKQLEDLDSILKELRDGLQGLHEDNEQAAASITLPPSDNGYLASFGSGKAGKSNSYPIKPKRIRRTQNQVKLDLFKFFRTHKNKPFTPYEIFRATNTNPITVEKTMKNNKDNFLPLKNGTWRLK